MEIPPDSLEGGGVNKLLFEVTVDSMMNHLHQNRQSPTGDFLNPSSNVFFWNVHLQ